MRIGVFFILVFSCHLADAQNKHTISGYIEDVHSAEKLISATLFDLVNQQGVITNTYGFYSLTLPIHRTPRTCKTSMNLLCFFRTLWEQTIIIPVLR